jgi:hypothetical protein
MTNSRTLVPVLPRGAGKRGKRSGGVLSLRRDIAFGCLQYMHSCSCGTYVRRCAYVVHRDEGGVIPRDAGRHAQGDMYLTEANGICLVVFGMHDRTWGPYLAVNNRTLIVSDGTFGARTGPAMALLTNVAVSVCPQCVNPARDLPIGLLGSLGIVSLLYLLAVMTLCLMLPYEQIPINAAFSEAFGLVGMKWWAPREA